MNHYFLKSSHKFVHMVNKTHCYEMFLVFFVMIIMLFKHVLQHCTNFVIPKMYLILLQMYLNILRTIKKSRFLVMTITKTKVHQVQIT